MREKLFSWNIREKWIFDDIIANQECNIRAFMSELPLIFQNQYVFLPLQTQSIVWRGSLKKLETITSKIYFSANI